MNKKHLKTSEINIYQTKKSSASVRWKTMMIVLVFSLAAAAALSSDLTGSRQCSATQSHTFVVYKRRRRVAEIMGTASS